MMKRTLLILASALCLCCCGQKPLEPKVMARYVPERADDFVFENNLIAGRIYGKALEGNPTSPGIDIWVKKPGRLVANEWYAQAQVDPNYYHHDHGEGKDCYKVGRSLGGGGSGSELHGHATGTPYWRGGLTRINEGGRGEIVDLPNGTRIIPHDKSMKEVGSGTTVNVNLTVSGNVIGNREFMEACGQYIANKTIGALGVV